MSQKREIIPADEHEVVLRKLLELAGDPVNESKNREYYRALSVEDLWEELFELSRKIFNRQAATAMFVASRTR